MDDILVFGHTKKEHDDRLMAVFNHIAKAGLTLNADKCEFAKRSVKFLGQLKANQESGRILPKLQQFETWRSPGTSVS